MFRTQDHGPVRVLLIDNPDRKNAIPPSGWPKLADHLEAFAESEQRVLVIAGEGGDFCSGADLGDTSTAAGSVVSFKRDVYEQVLAEFGPRLARR